ncbi:uncharacterized protein ATC70_005635 [Mucor velutinosus]|uniref:Mitochondrial carrier n=1 Tax=Mucor velutinosus TaxID=708070 RepID=A0AAN7D9X6_9FUNG|nr:hypothetical protein ATC70_005635 [Mucor velutinosus]
MTLSAYLGLLSLGSTIQTRYNAECQEEEQQELDALRAMAQHISAAEIDTVSAVSIHHAPSERRVEVRENITGVVLAIGTMVANYSLCFPIVAARHRLQAVPTYQSYERDTPLYGIQTILYTYRHGGIRRLYPGFGLGLIGQTLSATYESGLNQVMSPLIASANKTNTLLGSLTALLAKGLALFVNIPLYPLYRNALILRVQQVSPSSQIVIDSPHDFIRLYKLDLRAFWPGNEHHRQLMNGFIPSCALNLITERLLIYIYRHLFQSFSNNSNSTTTTGTTAATIDHSSENLTTATPSGAGHSTASASSTSLASPHSKKKRESTVLHTFYPEIACGVISSILTRALSYPVETVIYKLMVQDTGVLTANTDYRGFLDCVKRTWYEEGGWKAFYPGWGIGVLEIGMGYLILEASWWAYRATQWKLQVPGTSDTRAVRKARKLRERLL